MNTPFASQQAVPTPPFRSRFSKLSLCVSVLALATAGCRRTLDDASRKPDVVAPAELIGSDTVPDTELQGEPEPDAVSPYARGRWRLGDWNDLSAVSLWGSHILIRHSSSDPGYVFSPARAVTATPPNRSRQEAQRIAEDLARSARLAPDDFPRLAREHSEDTRTAEQGGVFGTIMAAQLLPWPMVLDTFSAIQTGEVSQVVETNYGFHVFRRLSPPVEETVTGAHIVIAHDDVPGIARLLGKYPPKRSREEAQQLAGQIFLAATGNPSTFDALVAKYSEHPDAIRAGDLGTWSTREPSSLGEHIELLRHLKVGEVAQPIDTPYGYQIVQRQANRPREEYALDVVELTYEDTAADESPTSRQAILQKAMSLLEELKTRPARFREYQQEECCLEPQVWLDGRGVPQLANAVLELRVGELALAPIDAGYSFFVARRIDVPKREPRPARFELPAPNAPDFAFMVSVRNTAWVREQLKRVAEQAEVLTENLPPPQRAGFLALHDQETGLDELAAPPQRVDAFAAMQHAVKELLGNDGYSRYLQILNLHFEQEILAGF